MKIIVKNNGVGPALIKSSQMSIGDDKFENFAEVFRNLFGTDRLPYLSGKVDNRVLPPGEEIKVLEITRDSVDEVVHYTLLKKQFELKICYESVYGDQWTSYGTNVEEGDCK